MYGGSGSNNQRLNGYLFLRSDLDATLQGQNKKATEAIDTCEEQLLLNRSEEDSIREFFNEYGVKPITMLFEQQEIHNDGKEQIDVSNDYSRLGPMMFPGREHKVEAQYVIVAIPFTGDKALFDCKPAMFSTNHLQGEIEGEEVHFKFSGTPITEEELKSNWKRGPTL